MPKYKKLIDLESEMIIARENISLYQEVCKAFKINFALNPGINKENLFAFLLDKFDMKSEEFDLVLSVDIEHTLSQINKLPPFNE